MTIFFSWLFTLMPIAVCFTVASQVSVKINMYEILYVHNMAFRQKSSEVAVGKKNMLIQI